MMSTYLPTVFGENLMDVFDDFDDEFVSNEESYTEDVARYVDEHLLEMVKPV